MTLFRNLFQPKLSPVITLPSFEFICNKSSSTSKKTQYLPTDDFRTRLPHPLTWLTIPAQVRSINGDIKSGFLKCVLGNNFCGTLAGLVPK